MDKITKSINGTFWWALGLSIGFPIGVICIVFGAIKGIVAMLVIGILLAVAGFYVMPILWVKYGEKRSYRTILRLILEEHIYTVQGLCNQTNKNPNHIRYVINYLIMREYLTGFLFHEDVLELNRNKKQEAKNARTTKCGNCGGLMQFDGVNYVCDYCGNVVKK